MSKLFFGTFLITASGIGYIYQSLPAYLQENPAISQKVVMKDRNGLVVRTYSKGETYDWISLKDVPVELKELIIHAEDKNFYNHNGFDFSSALRSLWLNAKAMRVVSGASTITQQVYRQSFSIHRGFLGKLETVLGAIKVERYYSKEKILEVYLNTLPYAYRLVGVKRAGEVIFGKDIHLLSLSELATLAVLPRSPSGLRSRKESLLAKRNQLLRDYARAIKLPETDLHMAETLPLEFQNDYSGWENFHYAETLREQRNFSEFVSSNGIVETTLDLYLQKETQGILRAHLENLKKFDVNHGAVVVLDNNNGDVLAYVGSQDLTNERGGHYDALKIKRQPGSALKPLTFALGIMKGKNLSDVLPDIPSYYKTGLGQFLPRNYDQNFSGPRLMREALANSLNLPAVALADELGVESLYDFYKTMGLSLSEGASHYGVGMTLGNIEITPFELAEVYTAFAREGISVSPRFFSADQIRTKTTPLTKESAYLISDVLSDQIARREEFGESNPFDFPFSFSVKTGTSTDFRDNWVVGFNRNFTIVVWVGNADQRPMKRVSGVTGAGPVLRDVVKFLSKREMMRPVAKSENIEAHTVCALSGKKPGPNCSHTKREFFVRGKFSEASCEWHQEVVVRDCRMPGKDQRVKVALLPDAYQSWVTERPEWSVDHQINEQCPNIEKSYNHLVSINTSETVISKPLSGSIYAIDPNIPKAFQKLKLEISRHHQVKNVLWKKDGKEIQNSSGGLDWPMEKGVHHFEADVLFDDGKKVQTPSIEVKIL